MSEITDAFDALERAIDNLEREVKELRAENKSLEEQLEEANSENGKLTAHNKEFSGAPEMMDAIDAFCDVVDRPTGKLVYTVPQSLEANRAILGLFDAINRNA